MLTRQEKDDLMTVINILFDDNQLRGLKTYSQQVIVP